MAASQRKTSETLCKFIRETIGEPKQGAEVGVWKGETSACLLKSFPDLMLYLVDPWIEWEAGSSYQKKHKRTGSLSTEEWCEAYSICLQNIAPYPNRSWICRETSESAATLMKKHRQGTRWPSMDFVFIDANHTYDSVKHDIELWTPLTSKLICGHDYGGRYAGVKKAVDEAFGEANVLRPGALIWGVLLEPKDENA